MSNFFDVLISVSSVVISFYLGSLQSDKSFSREQAKLRYNEFYVPLFTLLYAGMVWKRPPHTLNFEARCKILDLLTHSLSLLGPSLQQCYPDMYLASLHMLWYENGDSGYEKAPAEYDRIFMRIEKRAISEARALSKSLHLTSIAETYESRLRSSNKRRARQASE